MRPLPPLLVADGTGTKRQLPLRPQPVACALGAALLQPPELREPQPPCCGALGAGEVEPWQLFAGIQPLSRRGWEAAPPQKRRKRPPRPQQPLRRGLLGADGAPRPSRRRPANATASLARDGNGERRPPAGRPPPPPPAGHSSHGAAVAVGDGDAGDAGDVAAAFHALQGASRCGQRVAEWHIRRPWQLPLARSLQQMRVGARSAAQAPFLPKLRASRLSVVVAAAAAAAVVVVVVVVVGGGGGAAAVVVCGEVRGLSPSPLRTRALCRGPSDETPSPSPSVAPWPSRPPLPLSPLRRFQPAL